jgi:putative copper export protein
LTSSLLPYAVTTLDRAALALIVGAAAVRLFVLPAQRAPGRMAAAVPPLLLIALALFACSSAGDLVLRTAALADVAPADAWPFIGQALMHSDYGTFWQLRAATWLVLSALALMMMRRGGNNRTADWGLAGAAAMLVFAMSSTGHGGNEGSLTLPNLINILHITGACLWGGTVVVYVAVILPRLRHGAAPAQTIAQTATRLSTLAGAALALVLATGVYNAWRQLGDWQALWTTEYGSVLLIKLAAVGVMMAIGAGNRFFIVPAVETWAQRTADGGDTPVLRFLRVLRLDAAVFVFVLACAAVLGTQIPPAHLTGAEDEGTAAHTTAPPGDD